MDNFQIILIILSVATALCGIMMAVSRNPISVALSLLGVLLFTAGIYGLMAEHLVATLQLVVYAGAVMVLFIFSIMLLNLNVELKGPKIASPLTWGCALLVSGTIFLALVKSFVHFLASPEVGYSLGQSSESQQDAMNGQTYGLAVELFAKHYIAFELMGVALLIAIIGAVVLAKRKID